MKTCNCRETGLPSKYSAVNRSDAVLYFFFTAPPPTEFYTLSLHDALPISGAVLHFDPATCPADDRLVGHFQTPLDRKSTRLNSSHTVISYAVFCLKKKIHITVNFGRCDRVGDIRAYGCDDVTDHMSACIND